MTEKLCVFISYKRKDQLFAERLWEMLHTWDCETWLDVKNIPSGISEESSGWIDAIHKGLKRSHVLIGVVSPESLQSERVKEEWNWAKLTNRRILLLRLRPFNIEEMPPPFATANYIDLVEDEQSGFEQLRTVLQGVHRERDEFKAEITPPTRAHSTSDQPKAIPLYLLRKRGGHAETDISRSGKLTEVEQMRRRVYQYWVQGIMQTALKEVESVGIALDMQPEAVVRDTSRNIGDIALPNDSRHVRRVYDIFKSFLILGDPGAGKTILLLQLAESLILNPPPTHNDAIPLVLNLSSWALQPRPLREWLEEEVWRTYRVRANHVHGWLKNNQLILLLDGLDEVKEEKRAACVETINNFRKDYSFVPVVVCSRIKDYKQLGETKLELPGAILLEALSQTQIDRYLSDPSLMHLKRIMAGDVVLQEMATTPFLLNTMIYAYRHEPEDALRGFDTEAQRREHLFNTYVQRRLKDHPSPFDYQQTIASLQWLATKMQAYVQTVFHLEDIQPEWASDDSLYRKLINGFSNKPYMVLFAGLYALLGWQTGEWIGALIGTAGGALIGFMVRVLAQVDVFEGRGNKLLIGPSTTLRRALFDSMLTGSMFGMIGILFHVGTILGIAAVLTLTYLGFNMVTLVYQPLLWMRLYHRKNLPPRPLYFLDALSDRQILRRMGGGYIFIHRYLLEHFARVDEVFILIDQVLSNNYKMHDKAASALINIGRPAVRHLYERLEQRPLSPDQMGSIYFLVDMIQPRPGIGLRPDGLPDIEWLDIPEGTFIYGDKSTTTLSLPSFQISRYPITYRQFQAFIDAEDGWHNPQWWAELAADDTHKSKTDEQNFKFWNHPRTSVSWYDAMAFCRWISAKLNLEICLPTEFEWEKAARGSDGRLYPYGNDFDAMKGNTSGPVGMFPSGKSPYGVEDMSGKVWQWCLTDYNNPAMEARNENISSHNKRVLRGGSWIDFRYRARATYRYLDRPDVRDDDIGFRVVVSSSI